MKQVVWWSVFIVLVFHGATSVLIGWQRNNQGEFYDFVTGRVDWAYIAIKALLFPLLFLIATFVVRRMGK